MKWLRGPDLACGPLFGDPRCKRTKRNVAMNYILNRLRVLNSLFSYSDEVELAPIARDKSYDFNFQETRHLPEERVFQPGDSMQIVCNYKTKNIKKEITMVSITCEKHIRLLN